MTTSTRALEPILRAAGDLGRKMGMDVDATPDMQFVTVILDGEHVCDGTLGEVIDWLVERWAAFTANS